mgnify:CR=1 FL=1
MGLALVRSECPDRAERLSLIRDRAEEQKMGSDAKKAYGAAGRDELLWFEFDKLVLVTDTSHPLYDERVHLPLDEAMVLNIMQNGIIEPGVVRKNGHREDGSPVVEIVDGRQRYKCGKEADRRLRLEGKEGIRYPAVRRQGDSVDLFGVMISANEIRKGDDSIVRAKKLARYLATGKSKAEAAIAFGVTQSTVKNLLELLDLHPDVQKAVEGGLPITIAKELSSVPQEEQPGKLAELVASGNVSGTRGIEAAKEIRRGRAPASDKVRMMSRPKVEAWKKALKKLEGRDVQIALAVVDRLLGREKALSDYPKLEATLVPETEEKTKTGTKTKEKKS